MDTGSDAMKAHIATTLATALLLAVPALGQDYAGTAQGYRQRLTTLKAERADVAARAEGLDRSIAQLEGAIAAVGELQKQAAQAAEAVVDD